MLKLAIILAVATVCCVHAETKFLLYTRKNPSVPEEINDFTSLWNHKYFSTHNNTIMLIHGHGGSVRSTFNTLITDSKYSTEPKDTTWISILNYVNIRPSVKLSTCHYVKKPKVLIKRTSDKLSRREKVKNYFISNILKYQEPHNVIVVDWEKDASYSYSISSQRVPFIAREIERFMYRVFLSSSHLYNLHLVGFGLGAHIAGIASRWTNAIDGLNERVERITGLDPSGSGWGTNSERLMKTDANYVEVIHTDGSGLFSNGIGTAIGDVNFYVNGGSNQPGCLTNSCSHNRAYEVFAASMVNPHLVGYPCSSTTQMNLNRCGGTALHMGGIEMNKRSSSSIYRINTNRNYPF